MGAFFDTIPLLRRSKLSAYNNEISSKESIACLQLIAAPPFKSTNKCLLGSPIWILASRSYSSAGKDTPQNKILRGPQQERVTGKIGGTGPFGEMRRRGQESQETGFRNPDSGASERTLSTEETSENASYENSEDPENSERTE